MGACILRSVVSVFCHCSFRSCLKKFNLGIRRQKSDILDAKKVSVIAMTLKCFECDMIYL